MKIQRERIEQIEKELEKGQILVFFDFTKYNYLCHDLGFVLLYRDAKNILQRRYFHYLHSKWDEYGTKVPNDAKYTITAFELFFKRIKEIWQEVSDEYADDDDVEVYPEWVEIFLASDGGPHFVNAVFIDYLTRKVIAEWDRFAPHHGGNYGDGEFGVCKRLLRKVESDTGRQRKTVEEIIDVLRSTVKDRKAEFVKLDKIITDEELEYVYKTPAFPFGIKNEFSMQFRGENHIVYYYSSSDIDAEWNWQKINCESKNYSPIDEEEGEEQELKEETEENEGDERFYKAREREIRTRLEIQGTIEEDEFENVGRVCYGCGEIIDENQGYLKCNDHSCHRIYHALKECHNTSYGVGESRPFRCKPCKRGIF